MSSLHDIFYSPFYKIVFYYWRFIGFWPYDDFKKTKRLLVMLIILASVIPQVIKLFEVWHDDFDLVIEIIGNLIFFFGAVFKYLSFVQVEAQMTFLFDKIAKDWKSIKYMEELEKLEEYGFASRRLSLGYMIPINILTLIYLSVPLTPILLDVINPLNETRPRIFPHPVDYFIDHQKYYFLVFAHSCATSILSVQIFGAFDTTCVCFVQHACALFAIVEIRMRRAAKITTSKKYKTMREREAEEYQNTRAAILIHKDAIQFIDEIERSYSLVFFLVVSLTSAVICIVAVVALLSYENGNIKSATRFAALYVGYSMHLLYNMYPGQLIIDHSTDIQHAVYNCEWYNLTKKTKQLLRIMMLRSMKPCTFTGEKMIELNVENFASVFRKSFSYVTMLGSLR